ncbi:MAG TPA: hypothetical protein VGD89_04350 [Flavipsychrobacter sp.]
MHALLSLVFFIGAITLAIAFIATRANLLKTVSQGNRKLDPIKVWYLLIPIFSYYWSFIVAKKIAESIDSEYKTMGVLQTNLPTYSLGLLFAISNAINGILTVIQILELDIIYDRWYITSRSIFSLILIIIWITYWIQLSNHKKNIKRLNDKALS